MNKQHNTTGTFSTGTNNFPVNPNLFQSLSKVTQIIAAGLLTLALAAVIQVASTSVASAQIHGAHDHEELAIQLPAEPVCLEAESLDCNSSSADYWEHRPKATPPVDDPYEICPESSCNDWGNYPGPEPLIPTDFHEDLPSDVVLDVWRTVDFSSLDAIKHFGNSVCDESIGHLYGIRCAFYNLPDHLRPFETHDHDHGLPDELELVDPWIVDLGDLWFVVDFTSIDSFNHEFVSQGSYTFADFGFPSYDPVCSWNEEWQEEVCITLG